MTGSQIASLGSIVGTIYKSDGSIRSFLVDYGSGRYGLYCKEVCSWGMSISMEQVEEFLKLLQSPITEPNKEELQNY